VIRAVAPAFAHPLLDALRATGLLDAAAVPALDRIAGLAGRLLGAPVGLVTLLDGERQLMPGAFGREERELPLAHSICRHVVTRGQPLVVADAREDVLLRDSPAVRELGVGAYVGAPIRLDGGPVIGTVCALEHAPRLWDEEHVALVRDLAETVGAEIALRLALVETRAAEERFRALVEAMPAVGYEGGVAGNELRYLSPRVEEWTGTAAQDFTDAPTTWAAHVHPDDRDALRARACEAVQGDGPLESEYRLADGQGGWRWVRDRQVLVRDAEGRALHRLGTVVDVSAMRALADARARLQTVVDAAPMVFFVLDAEGRFTVFEGGRAGDPRLGRDRLLGQSVFTVCAGDPRVVENCRRALAGEAFTDLVPRGDLVFETRYEPISGGGAVGVAMDVTERHRSEQRLAYLAYHDSLTGLPNRANLDLALRGALARRRRGGHAVALLSIDLDGFKLVNDSLGHEGGDALLRQVAARLDSVTRAADVLARPGGDEFAMLLEAVGDASAEAAGSAARRVLAALEAPFAVQEAEFTIGASIGIALAPRHGEDPADLLRRADAALYQAKAAGRGAIATYAAERDDTRRKLTLTRRLSRAIERDELLLHYQPISRLATGAISSLEALVRWQDPDHGLLAPGQFIPHAEETGLIDAVGEWVVDEVCRQTRAWQDRGLEVSIGFNAAPRQLRRPGFARMVEAAIARHGLGAPRLTLELTESAAMHDPERTVPLLRDLRALGVRIAIDDFGAHHSSLARLRDLPVDILKIDRAFLRDVPGEPAAEAFVVAILALARALSLPAIAEGIEHEGQRAFLVAHGCALGQGFGLGRPADAETTTALLLAAAGRQPLRSAGRVT